MANPGALRVAAIVLWACAACETRTVVPVEVASVDLDPTALEIVVGQSRTARAVPRGQGGEMLGGRQVSWATDESAVATVDGEGRVQGVAPGETTLRATVEGVVGTAPVTVLEGPSVALAQASLTLQAFIGGDSDTRVVAVTNGGHGELSGLSVAVTYRAGDPTGWLTAGLGGTTAPTDLSLTASAGSLTPGAYQATVTVASPINGGSSAAVTVDLRVDPPPPTIVLGDDAVSFSGLVGGQKPAVQDVDVANGGSGVLSGLSVEIVYEGKDTGWLQADLASTTAPTTIELRASVGLLPVGRYQATVEVHSDVALNSPQVLTVDFEVSSASASARGAPAFPDVEAHRR